MGFFRALAKAVCSASLISSIIILILLSAAFYATSATVLKPVFTDFLSKSMPFNISDARLLAQQCAEDRLPLGNESLEISCDKLKAASNDELKALFLEALFNKAYGYPCSGLECLQRQDFPGLFSSGFNAFLAQLRLVAAAAVVIFALLVVLLSKGLFSKLASLGGCAVIAGIPALLISQLEQRAPAEMAAIAGQLFAVLRTGFTISLIAGVGLFVVAAILKIALKKREKEKKPKK